MNWIKVAILARFSNTENSQVMGSSNPASVNGIPVVIVKQGDSWESIASSSGTDLQKLLKYNEASLKDPLSEGSYVYLNPKSIKPGNRTIFSGWRKYSQYFAIIWCKSRQDKPDE